MDFTSNVEINADAISASKTIKVGTCLGSIEKAVYKPNGAGWMDIFFQATEETEGLNNVTQPCGNPSYQYAKTSFSLSENSTSLKTNYSIKNWITYIAAVIGEKDSWTEVASKVNSFEEYAEAITNFFSGKDFVTGIQGEWVTKDFGDGEKEYIEVYLPKSNYFAANKDKQENIDKLIKYVNERIEEKEANYPWIKDNRDKIPEKMGEENIQVLPDAW